MKILVLTNLYPPQDALTEALRLRGHEVQVLTSNHGTQAAEPHVDRSLQIYGCHGYPWLRLNALKRLELHNNHTLRETLRVFKPDVVHIGCMDGLSKSLCLTLQRSGVPTVYAVNDHWILRIRTTDVWLDWWNRTQGSIASRVRRALWTLCGIRKRCDALAPTNPARDIRFDRLYFCSAHLRELTAKQGYDVMHGAVIHCPVDTQKFQGPPVARTPKNWLWVGRLAEEEGILTTLRALLLIKDSFSGELHVYGKGDEPYVTLLKQFATDHSLPVTWHDDQPAVYHSHDALLFTPECEPPCPLTPLEAMACGLPVIVTSSELFRHGQNALTYDPGAATQLAECILLLQSDAHLRESIAKEGHREVHERFAMAPIVDQIEHYLRGT